MKSWNEVYGHLVREKHLDYFIAGVCHGHWYMCTVNRLSYELLSGKPSLRIIMELPKPKLTFQASL